MHGEDDEPDPDEGDVEVEVVGEAAGHAGDHPVLGRSAERTGRLLGHGGDGFHVVMMRPDRRPANREWPRSWPRGTPEPPPGNP